MHRAKVTKVSAAGVWVQCTPIVPGVDFGPCQRIGSAPSVGDWVLVADVGESASPELVVLGNVKTTADPAPDLPVGAILAYSGNTAPAGWHLCNGTAHGSAALLAISGSANAPDLRDKFIAGAGSAYARGDTGGAATVTLFTSQMPSHVHDVGPSQDGTTMAVAAAQQSTGAWSGWEFVPVATTGNFLRKFIAAATGGGGSHENRPPYYALVYIVKV